jgi:hypothetical protein
MSNRLITVIINILFVESGPLMKLNENSDFFSHFMIITSNNLHRLNCLDFMNIILDFLRIYIFASSNDNVLNSAYDTEITLMINNGQISWLNPALRIKCSFCIIRIIPISIHGGIASKSKFPWLSYLHYFFILIYYLCL